MEPYQTGSSSLAIDKINQMLAQKKAAGKKVEPWELEAAIKAALESEANQASSNYFKNKEIALAEKKFSADEQSRKDALAAGKDASTMGAVGNLATMGLAAKSLGLIGAKPIAGTAGASYLGSGAPATVATATPAAGSTASTVAAGTTVPAEGAAGLGGSAGITATVTPYIAPVAASFVAPKLIDAIHKDSMENLGHNLSFGLIKHEKTAKAFGSAAAGAAAGAAMAAWTGPGAAVGAVIGGVVGALSSACIIITACTSPDSEEVKVARLYRDKYLEPEQLRGYYMMSEKFVPYIIKYMAVKWLTKKILVDSLHECFKFTFNLGPRPRILPRIIKDSFLWLCRKVGNTRTSFVRSNGEVF